MNHLTEQYKQNGISVTIPSTKVNIPANTTADVFVPSKGKILKIDGVESKYDDLVKDPGLEYHFLKINKGSGNYVFIAEY